LIEYDAAGESLRAPAAYVQTLWEASQPYVDVIECHSPSFPVDTRTRVTWSALWRHQDHGATWRAATLPRSSQLSCATGQRRRTSVVSL